MSLTSPTSAGGFFTTSTMWDAHASFNKSPKKGGKKDETGTSLGVQWIGICLAVQGTQIQSLAQEDATEQHMLQNNEAHGPQLLKPVHSRAGKPQLLSLRIAGWTPWAESLCCTRETTVMRNP